MCSRSGLKLVTGDGVVGEGVGGATSRETWETISGLWFNSGLSCLSGLRHDGCNPGGEARIGRDLTANVWGSGSVGHTIPFGSNSFIVRLASSGWAVIGLTIVKKGCWCC